MKRLILALVMCLISICSYCQAFGHFKAVYKTVDTLVVQKVQSTFPTKDGDYLVSLPNEDMLVVAYNADHSKAIVLHGYVWGKRMEFNVKYNESRLILWYKNEHIYCGYVYDEKMKACQYFEAINETEKNRLVNKLPFLKYKPYFIEDEKE